MSGPFTAWFETEHRALGRLFHRSLPRGEATQVDAVRFDLFRRRLLQRIAVEERVLFPALVAKLGHMPLYRTALSKDHGGLVSLCAPQPEREWVEGLWEQLEFHHSIEMSPESFCADCNRVLAAEATDVLAKASALPPLEVPPYGQGAGFRAAIGSLLKQTGL